MIKRRQEQPFQTLQGSCADIMLYSRVRQHIHESNYVHIKESPAQQADLYVDMSVKGLMCESEAALWQYKNKYMVAVHVIHCVPLIQLVLICFK